MSQKERVLEYLNEHGSITSWDAIRKMHITRLAEIIRRLKEDGYEIESTWEQKKRKGETIRWVRYTLMK